MLMKHIVIFFPFSFLLFFSFCSFLLLFSPFCLFLLLFAPFAYFRSFFLFFAPFSSFSPPFFLLSPSFLLGIDAHGCVFILCYLICLLQAIENENTKRLGEANDIFDFDEFHVDERGLVCDEYLCRFVIKVLKLILKRYLA